MKAPCVKKNKWETYWSLDKKGHHRDFHKNLQKQEMYIMSIIMLETYYYINLQKSHKYNTIIPSLKEESYAMNVSAKIYDLKNN